MITKSLKMKKNTKKRTNKQLNKNQTQNNKNEINVKRFEIFD